MTGEHFCARLLNSKGALEANKPSRKTFCFPSFTAFANATTCGRLAYCLLNSCIFMLKRCKDTK